MKKGMYVRFTDTDDQGEYSFVGQIESINDKEINLIAESPYFHMTLPISDLDKLVEIKKPRNFDAKVAKPAAQAVEQPAKENVKPKTKKVPKAPKAKKTGTRAEQVLELVKANKSMTRQQLIDLVVKKVGMTPAGASTYVSNARKTLKD